jgi:GDP-L-fucose synthase
MNKRIVITGGTGFLGSHVVDKLKTEGYSNVFAFGRNRYDLRSMNDIDNMLAELKPEVIIHLAAVVGGIGANMNYPGTFFYDNLIIGAQLMEKSRLAEVKKFVSIGTVCSYPKYTEVPFKEEDIWNGYPEETNASYGLAKKMLIVQSKAYKEQYGFNSINLIPTNLYGPGDNFDPNSSHVIPALIRKFIKAKKEDQKYVTVWGTGKASREFLYVEDCSEAIILAMEKHNDVEPINIGSGNETSIRELVNMIKSIAGYRGKIVWDKTKPDGQPRRSIDTSKAKKELGFVPKTDFRTGLKNTIKWYKSNKTNLD